MRAFESNQVGAPERGEAAQPGGGTQGKATLTQSLGPEPAPAASQAAAGEGAADGEMAVAGDELDGGAPPGGAPGGGGGGGGAVAPVAPAMTMSAVTISVTKAAEALSQRGSAEYKVKWSVGGGKNGWVVQHVKFQPAIQNSAGGAAAARNPSIEYWEGWQVRGGNVFVGSGASAHQADTFRTISEAADTKGRIQVIGKVAFLENYNLTEPPWGHTVAAAGALPTMTSAPDGWSDGSAQNHTMTVNYDDVAKTPQTQVGNP